MEVGKIKVVAQRQIFTTPQPFVEVQRRNGLVRVVQAVIAVFTESREPTKQLLPLLEWWRLFVLDEGSARAEVCATPTRRNWWTNRLHCFPQGPVDQLFPCQASNF